MNWGITILCGLVCAVAGAAGIGYVAEKSVSWFHWSTREGAAGYQVIFFALLGFAGGLAIGVTAARLAGTPWKGLGAGVAVVLAVCGTAWTVARVRGDVPPVIDGEELELLVEFRMPAGWEPSNRVRNGRNARFNVRKIVEGRMEDQFTGEVSAGKMRQEKGRWILPAHAFLYTRRGQRAIVLEAEGSEPLRFLTSLPASPGREFLEWSEWLPRVADDDPVAHGARYRLRVERRETWRRNVQNEGKPALDASGPFAQLLAAFAFPDAEGDYHEAAGAAIRQRSAELAPALASSDRELARLALNALSALNEVHGELTPALQTNLRHMATGLQSFQSSLDAQDPDHEAAEEWVQQYQNWRNGWNRARYREGFENAERIGAAMPPVRKEMEAIRKAAEQMEGSLPEFKTLVSMVKDDLEGRE